ncbi:MAG: hypothetical protein KKF44_11645, partial [Nanoarchaeota archaeon]|nr:hypothetical protein [Nanoarchaeota archaeon]
MEVKQAIKKVIALATGASIVGATLVGAMAQNLADYPMPFVKEGVFSDSVVVVGEKAAPSDILGAIEIAASLQAAAVSVEPVEVSTATAPTVDDGAAIAKSGDKLNYEETLSGVQATALDSTDMPDVLEDATYNENRGNTNNEVDYEQTLTFSGSTGYFRFKQPDDMDAGNYLFFGDGDTIYTYTLEFDSAVEYDTTSSATEADDFEGSKIELQGNMYTITDAKFSSDVLTELTLVAGDTTRWLQQDQPLTVGDHTVMVVNVDDATSTGKCGVEVDGVMKWIDVGTTEEFGDLSVGVLDAIAVHSKDYDQDTCEISIGSTELELKDDNRVKVNGVELDGTDVQITSTAPSTGGEFTKLEVTYEPDEDLDLAPGEAWTDPIFNNFKIVFAGVTEDPEEMMMKATSKEKAEFTYVNNDGKDVTVYYRYKSSTLFLGKDDDEEILLPGDEVTESSNAEGSMLLYTTSGGETHLLKIKDIDTSRNQTDIEDLTYGTTWSDKDFVPEANSTITLGSLGSVKLNISANGYRVKFNSAAGFGDGTPETLNGALLTFNDTSVVIAEQDIVETSEITATTLYVHLSYDTGTDDRLELLNPAATGAAFATDYVDASEDDDNTQYAVTQKGTMVELDQEDDMWAKFFYSKDDVYGNAFVSPLSAKVQAGGSSAVNTEKVNAIPVGMSALDKDAVKMSKNMIVVGGPCVNVIAAELAGNPASCTEGYEAGKGKLKFYDRGSKVALLVAGYSAQDSLGTAYVLA